MKYSITHGDGADRLEVPSQADGLGRGQCCGREVSHSTGEKAGTGSALLIAQDLGVRQPGVVIDQ